MKFSPGSRVELPYYYCYPSVEKVSPLVWFRRSDSNTLKLLDHEVYLTGPLGCKRGRHFNLDGVRKQARGIVIQRPQCCGV